MNIEYSDLELALVRYGDLESKGWKGKEGTAIHNTNNQGNFYKELIKCFYKTKQVEIFEIYFNDKLVSSQIYLLNSSMIVLLKTTYDEDFSGYAPGRILCYELLQREFNLKRVKILSFTLMPMQTK